MDLFINAYRIGFRCCRRIRKWCGERTAKKQDGVPVHKLPWLWIGAHFRNSDPVSVTDLVNYYVRYGIPVTPTFLEELTGYVGATWTYMDSQTLEEKDFPSEGIVIDGP